MTTPPKISLREHALLDAGDVEPRLIEAAESFFRDLRPGDSWTLKLAKLLSDTYSAGYSECMHEPTWENPDDA